jgi:hypothetical protein
MIGSLERFMNMISQCQVPSLLGQALGEYSSIASLSAGFANLRGRIETYIGQGNLKYLLIGTAILVLVVWIRLRR